MHSNWDDGTMWGYVPAKNTTAEQTQKILIADFNDKTITEFVIKGSKEALLNLTRTINVVLQAGSYSYKDDDGKKISVVLDEDITK